MSLMPTRSYPVSLPSLSTLSGPVCWHCVWVTLQGSGHAPPLFQKHVFSVDMTCGSCAEAVSRVLDKFGGVKYDIDLPNKKICIESEHSVDTLLATLKKTGKTVSYLGLE
ncbi:PREDICTED: copper transport protein ATOX1 isoform X1 [Mandrillus leucophaeus]|nr:PREDICTED: copper transport protein ATOX1 isoform X1 [Mandrillus leucophaeus]